MKNNILFLDTFLGEYVEFIMDFTVVSSLTPDADGNLNPIETPLTVNGFFMDFQDGVIYLSPDGENINQAIKFDDFKHIAIVQMGNEVDEMLGYDNSPGNDGEYH